jgi:hypothetical protein
VAAAAASSRPLFFPAAFDDLDGDGFILQEQSVSKNPLGGYPKSFGWRRTWIYYGGSVRWEQIYLRWKRNGYSSNG